MNIIPNPKILLKTALIIVSSACSSISFAHSGGATLGASGKNAHATILASITCFDNGNGKSAGLYVELRDNSKPKDGNLISVQLFKGRQATNTTDQVSGDADYSDGVQLNGGDGVYQVILNKTDKGSRKFELTWHCMTKDHNHTGTDITVRQFE